MKHLVVVDVSVRIVFHAVMVGSIYLLFSGHNEPGGGFAAGLVAGAAIALRYVAGGIDEVRHLTPVKPWTPLGVGLLLAAADATAPLLWGHPVLDAASASLDLPLLGTVKVYSSLVFDIGVYLLVVGLVLMVFEAFGEDLDDPEEARP